MAEKDDKGTGTAELDITALLAESLLADGILSAGEQSDTEIEPPTEHELAEAARLRELILVALADLEKAEHIEIMEHATDRLADELTAACLEARNPRHLLKKLRVTLVASDLVEEVYAEDRVLTKFFRKALGG